MYSGYVKHSQKLKQKQYSFLMDKMYEHTPQQKSYKDAIKHLFTSLFMREMQSSNHQRQHYMPARIIKIKSPDNMKC